MRQKTNPGEATVMRFKLGVVLSFAAFLLPTIVQAQVPVGRWEIVHTSGDSSAQTALYPGGFSTFLNGDGTGSTSGTFANSICVADDEGFNVVPTWTNVSPNVYQITITVDNLGAAPNFAFTYTGTYSAVTPIPGDETVLIPTIIGTYVPTGDASACSTATTATPGTFIATFLPTVDSGFAEGALDSSDTGGGTPFDSSVNATITFSAPTTPGGISGVVTLDSNPRFGGAACFATTAGVVNPLTISATTSAQSGIIEAIYAQGFDPQGNPTTLVLDGYSANIYNTATNTDATANPITSMEWAAGAAIGEDNPAVTPDGVSQDGTNNIMVLFYGVVGGACDSAGGADSPFHLLSGKPVRHGHRNVRPRGKGKSDRDHDRDHGHDFGRQN
jgi:hypothetical protein